MNKEQVQARLVERLKKPIKSISLKVLYAKFKQEAENNKINDLKKQHENN